MGLLPVAYCLCFLMPPRTQGSTIRSKLSSTVDQNNNPQTCLQEAFFSKILFSARWWWCIPLSQHMGGRGGQISGFKASWKFQDS